MGSTQCQHNPALANPHDRHVHDHSHQLAGGRLAGGEDSLPVLPPGGLPIHEKDQGFLPTLCESEPEVGFFDVLYRTNGEGL